MTSHPPPPHHHHTPNLPNGHHTNNHHHQNHHPSLPNGNHHHNNNNNNQNNSHHPQHTALPNGNHHHNLRQQQQQQQQQRRPYYIPSTSSSSSASFKGCCCCLFLLLTLLALLAIAATLTIFLAIRPKKPTFDLDNAAVTYLLLSPSTTPTTNAAYLSLNITLLFTAQNPNKVGLRYAHSTFYLIYRGVPLGVATVPAFEQPAHSTRVIQTVITVSRVDVLQGDALALVKDAAVNDRVDLRIMGDVGASIRFLGITSPKVQVAVDCAIVISPRKQTVTYKQCGVDGVNV